jgi:hypothetical protein
MPRNAAKMRRIEEPTPITIPSPKHPERPALIDEFGRLGARLEQVKPLQTRYEQLRVQIAGWYNDSDPEQSYTDDGAEFSVQVGPRALKRSIADMAAVMERIGEKQFLDLVSLSLEKLDTVLLPRDQARLVTSDRIGPRTVKAIAKYTQTAA